MKTEIARDTAGEQAHLFDLASVAPLSSVVVQIMGGSMRIPALQDILLSEFQSELNKHYSEKNAPKAELGRLLNVDEAPAFGSTMYAATLIPRYSVKGVMLVEHAKRRVTMRITNEENTDAENAQQPQRREQRLPSRKSPLYEKGMFKDPDVIFVGDDESEVDVIPVGTPLPCQKTLIIPRSCPFTLSFDYPAADAPDVLGNTADSNSQSAAPTKTVRLPSLPLPAGVSSHLLSVDVAGSASSLSAFSRPAEWATYVSVEVGKDGVFRVLKATLDVACEADTEADSKSSVVKEGEEVDTEETSENKAETTENNENSNTSAADSASSAQKKQYVRRRMALHISSVKEHADGTPLRYIPLSKKEVKSAQKVLAAFDDFEKEKEQLAELRNTIEAYVFDMKEKFELQHEELLAVAEQSQLDNAQAVLEATAQWLDGDGAGLVLPTSPVPESEQTPGAPPKTPLQVLQKHLDEAQSACGVLVLRLSEERDFPAAASQLRKMVKTMKEKQDDAVANSQMSEDEADEMERRLDEALDWLKTADAERRALPKGAAPSVTSADVRARTKEAEKAANDALVAAERRIRQEKYEKERKARELKRQKEKERLQKEKRQREELKRKRLAKAGYEELADNYDDADYDTETAEHNSNTQAEDEL